MSQQDSAMRARVAGREAIAARTIWQLDSGGLRLRCVRTSAEVYELQGRTSKGWKDLTRSNDPLMLLRVAVSTKGVPESIRESILRTSELVK